MQNELINLDWFEVLQNIQRFATSEIAKSKILKTQSYQNQDEATQSMIEIIEAQNILSHGIRPFMESLDFYETWYPRLKINAKLKNIEIKDIRKLCIETIALTELFKQHPKKWAQSVLDNLMSGEEPLSAIDQIFSANGEIKIDASENLYRLYREKENLIRQVQQTLDKLVKSFSIEDYLQDKYVTTREGRWVLPIKSGQQHALPGIIHATSQTKQTVYIEPETVVPLNNRVRQIEVLIEEEIDKLIQQLSDYLYSIHQQFATTQQVLLKVDVKFAQAQFCSQIKAVKPEFNNKKFILKDVRHPLLVLKLEDVVANTVELSNEKHILILTGPNAGGKTILLKSIGLAAQMARAGLLICTEHQSELPFFENIIASIGDKQSVDENLSTFAGHIKLLMHAATLKNSNQLVLIDEICGSTDPEEGAALARSFILEFNKNLVFSVITSHLTPLKQGWESHKTITNGSLDFNLHTGKPTYKFLAGIPGDSLAIQTAKRVGVPQRILDQATEFLRPEIKARLAGLDELEQIKKDLFLLQDSLKKEKSQVNLMKLDYEKKLEQFTQERDQLLQREVKTAKTKIDEMIGFAKVEHTFKKHESLQNIKKELPQIVKTPQGASPQETIQDAQEFSKKFPPGSKVFIPSLSQDGIIQSQCNSKGEVMVLSNSLRLNIHWQELKPPAKFQNQTVQLARKSQVNISFLDQDRSLDLRGKTTEEALSDLEMSLDLAVRNQEDRIKIIHGHGTDALKKAVRAYLSRSVLVSKWKAASPEQGGDGVTFAELLL